MNRENIELVTKYLEFEKMFPPFIRDMETGLCTSDIATGWEWCFDPTQAIVLEKIDGTNVKIVVEGFKLEIYARNQKHKGYVKTELNDPQYKYINEAVVNRVSKRSKKLKDGEYYGEAIGLNIQGNKYELDRNMWYTFEPYKDGVNAYKDFPPTTDFELWKEWILNLNSLLNPNVEAEGVVFLNRSNGKMAKLRKDMFSTNYKHR
ncbi:RNA ligase family protein [Paenibacillus polymyxa]|uniref:RNA ligase family protein n=1 Tax=Paenibacillus polymyxa TaxID=1406 RepID=UPI00287F3F35|nr:RNA ligase family protein [Paenibacillus polymyxa]